MSQSELVGILSATPNMLVNDVRAAAAFYVEKLGFTVTIDAAEDNVVVLTRGGATLGVVGSQTAAGKSWCALMVTDPAPLAAEYERAGVTFVRPLQTWGTHSEFSIADLDGNRIDIGPPMY